MIILKPENGAKIGILVDEVREVVTLEEENIEKATRDEQGFNLLGVGKSSGIVPPISAIAFLTFLPTS